MSHPLRHPTAVPALFSQGAESDAAPRRRPSTARSPGAYRSVLFLPALLLTAELPLVRDAAAMLRLALPH